MPRLVLAATLTAAATALSLVSPARSADVIAEWSQVKPPPVPELKPASVDPKTTALLILDLGANCANRPRCKDSVAPVRRLHDAARTAGAMVFYTFAGQKPSADEIADPAMKPKPDEWIPQRGPDKFLGSVLEERLKARGIKTVIVVGTSAQGAIVGTGSAAAQRGYNVVVPVDGMSSEDRYMEQYAAWHMYKGGPVIVTEKVTLTRIDMIKFGN